jgi:hypothetical protein
MHGTDVDRMGFRFLFFAQSNHAVDAVLNGVDASTIGIVFRPFALVGAAMSGL